MFSTVYESVDVDEKPQTTNNNANEQHPCLRVNATAPNVYDKILLYEFNAVPLTSENESQWYGPWSSLLHRLFPPEQGFQFSLQCDHAKLTGEPGSYFIVKYYGCVTACIQVKPFSHYNHPEKRLAAYTQLHDRLEKFIQNPSSNNANASAIFGLSCSGPQYMIMKANTITGQIHPTLHIIPEELNATTSMIKTAPQKWWNNHILKKEGALNIHRFGEEVRKTLNSPPMPNHPIPIESLPEDYTDLKFSFNENMEG